MSSPISSGEKSTPENPGSAAGEVKETPVFHCNICNKELTGITRMKCAVCVDFNFCAECFFSGAGLPPHKSDHPYEAFGVKMYGMDNWDEVAGHVGTKTKDECMEHYRNAYVNSPDSLPVPGKDKKEVVAMGKEDGGIGDDLQDKAETLSILGDKDDIWARALVDTPKREELVLDMECKEADPDFVNRLKFRVVEACMRRDEDRNRYAALPDEERYLCQKYYDCMRFDSDEEHKQVIESLLAVHRYQKRKAAIKEARAAGCRTTGEINIYVELVKQRQAEEWKEYSEAEEASSSKGKLRSLTTAEVKMYLDWEWEKKQAARRKESRKRKEEAEEEENARLRAISVDPASWKWCRRVSPSALSPGGMTNAELRMNIERLKNEAEEHDPTVCAPTSVPQSERPLCRSLSITARHYLKIQEHMTKLIRNGRITQKSDSYRFFQHQISPAKIDKIYDVLAKKGIAPP